MNAKYFIDTNIFVYSFDLSQPEKRARSLELISNAIQTGDGLISTQVVQEFLNVATRKFSEPLKAEDCKTYLQKVLFPLCQIFPDLALFEATLDIQKETSYSFYDSLILAGSLHGGCTILYSEDLQAGRNVRGLEIVNPFN